MQATTATVQDSATHTRWKLPYAAIVVDPAQRAEQPPTIAPRPVEASTFKLGDTVRFTDKYLRERVGTITRIDSKLY